MERKSVIWVLLFILCGITGFSAAYIIAQQALLRQLKISYNRAEIGSGITFSKMVINLFLNFTNPSLIDIDIESYNFDVLIDGKPVVKLISTEPGYVAASGTSVVKLVVNINPVQTLGNIFSSQVIMGILFDYSKVIIELKGTVTANHRGIGMKDIPVDITDNLQNLLYGSTKPA